MHQPVFLLLCLLPLPQPLQIFQSLPVSAPDRRELPAVRFQLFPLLSAGLTAVRKCLQNPGRGALLSRKLFFHLSGPLPAAQQLLIVGGPGTLPGLHVRGRSAGLQTGLFGIKALLPPVFFPGKGRCFQSLFKPGGIFFRCLQCARLLLFLLKQGVFALLRLRKSFFQPLLFLCQTDKCAPRLFLGLPGKPFSDLLQRALRYGKLLPHFQQQTVRFLLLRFRLFPFFFRPGLLLLLLFQKLPGLLRLLQTLLHLAEVFHAVGVGDPAPGGNPFAKGFLSAVLPCQSLSGLLLHQYTKLLLHGKPLSAAALHQPCGLSGDPPALLLRFVPFLLRLFYRFLRDRAISKSRGRGMMDGAADRAGTSFRQLLRHQSGLGSQKCLIALYICLLPACQLLQGGFCLPLLLLPLLNRLFPFRKLLCQTKQPFLLTLQPLQTELQRISSSGCAFQPLLLLFQRFQLLLQALKLLLRLLLTLSGLRLPSGGFFLLRPRLFALFKQG